jgi:hypothetical protein
MLMHIYRYGSLNQKREGKTLTVASRSGRPPHWISFSGSGDRRMARSSSGPKNPPGRFPRAWSYSAEVSGSSKPGCGGYSLCCSERVAQEREAKMRSLRRFRRSYLGWGV